MRSFVIGMLAAGLSTLLVVPSHAKEIAGFQVPDGYAVELAAGPEHVQHPMMGCFDDDGRLYICESAGTNRKAAELIADPQDSIKVLEDTDGDGTYDKSWTYADKLVFPQGCLWYRGAVYTCSSPYLWKLEDTDGDGVCDKRTVLVKSFGFSGNAADIHGPFLSPDGRLYWCDGRHGHEINDFGDGHVGGADNVASVKPDPEPGLPNPDAGELITKGKAARIFSCRPDGSDLRVLAGGGMDNPVEVDFWESGECLGSVNLFYGRPRGDCLVHWVEGGVYPRDDMPHCIEEFPWTGGLLGPVTNYGHVAVSGLCRYRSDQFGDLTGVAGNANVGGDSLEKSRTLADRATFFVSQFNTHKIVQTIVERHGSTFRAVETRDFLVSDDPDFHPTDVLEDADGSLLVVDTGGWFRIGCPTSQVAKPEIAGGIYRIRKSNSHPVDDPRGLQVAWDKLQADPRRLQHLLGDARPAVRARAIDAAAKAMESAEQAAVDICVAVSDGRNEREIQGFVQAVGRVRLNPLSTHFIEDNTNPLIRLTAIQALPWHHTQIDEGSRDSATASLWKSIASDVPAESRAALEALARMLPHRAEEAKYYQVVTDVQTRLQQPDVDSVLQHAATVALTRIADRPMTAVMLGDAHARVQRAALIALDQMPDGQLTRDEVLPLLATSDAALREAALDVISRRKGWAGEAISLFQSWIVQDLTDAQATVLQRFIVSQANDVEIQEFVAKSLTSNNTSSANQAVLLDSIAAADPMAWPAEWTKILSRLLNTDSQDQQLRIMGIVASRGMDDLDNQLQVLLSDDHKPVELRVEALAALAPRLSGLKDADFGSFTSCLVPEAPPLMRLKVAASLAAIPLTESQLESAAGLFLIVDPSVAAALLPAFERTESEQVQMRVVKTLSKVDQLPSVSRSDLQALIRRFTPAAQAAAAPLLDRFDAQYAEAAQRIQQFLPWAEGGDASRGRYVFFGQTAACGKCHRIGNDGAQIGPDLSKIGAIRQPRDLVEAIILPSASFARDFHPYTAVTTEGRVVSGLITRQTTDSVVFRLTDLSEVRLPRDEIELLKEAETSIMPQGLEAKLNEQEFRDLLAYLQSLK